MSDGAALLREAAQTLREKAEAATPGPWGWRYGFAGAKRVPFLRLPGQDGIRMRAEDAELIALMDPTVALAVADLLDGWADDIAQHGGHHRSDDRALAVARAVLRRES